MLEFSLTLKKKMHLTIRQRNRHEKEEDIFFYRGGVTSDLVVLNHDNRVNTKNIGSGQSCTVVQPPPNLKRKVVIE